MPNFEKTISFGPDSAGKLEQSNKTLFVDEEALSNYLNSADSGIVCVECVTSRARCKILKQECQNCNCRRNRDSTGCLYNTQVFWKNFAQTQLPSFDLPYFSPQTSPNLSVCSILRPTSMFYFQGQYCDQCQSRYFGDPILAGFCSKCTCPLNKECDQVTGDCSDTCGGNTRVRSQNTNRYKYCHHQPHICWKINFQIGAWFLDSWAPLCYPSKHKCH